jgi:hypothetical protein
MTLGTIPKKCIKGMKTMAEEKQKLEQVVLYGEAYYTFVHSPQKDDKYGDKYKVDLVVEAEDGTPFFWTNPVTGAQVNMVEKCEALGARLETSPKFPGRFVRVKSKAEYIITNKETKKKEIVERGPIPVVDANKNPIGPETLIGNGSKVRVLATVKPWVLGDGSSGVSLYLERMIVDELVPYVSSAAGAGEFDFPHLKKPRKETTDKGTPFNDEINF